MYAAKMGHADMARLLLANGAAPQAARKVRMQSPSGVVTGATCSSKGAGAPSAATHVHTAPVRAASAPHLPPPAACSLPLRRTRAAPRCTRQRRRVTWQL